MVGVVFRAAPALFFLYVYFYAYIIYNKSVKGSEFMNQLEQIGEISTAGNGVLRTSEVIVLRMYGKMDCTYYSFVARKQSFLTIQPCFCLI